MPSIRSKEETIFFFILQIIASCFLHKARKMDYNKLISPPVGAVARGVKWLHPLLFKATPFLSHHIHPFAKSTHC